MEEVVYRAVLDLIPPTTNNLYITTRAGHRFPNPKFAPIVQRIAAQLPHVKLPPAWYKLNISLYFPVYTKTGSNHGRVKKLDASNRIKLLEDELTRAIGLDDMFFKGTQIFKYNYPSEHTEVEIIKLAEIPEDWTKSDGENTIDIQFLKKEKIWQVRHER